MFYFSLCVNKERAIAFISFQDLKVRIKGIQMSMQSVSNECNLFVILGETYSQAIDSKLRMLGTLEEKIYCLLESESKTVIYDSFYTLLKRRIEQIESTLSEISTFAEYRDRLHGLKIECSSNFRDCDIPDELSKRLKR